MEDLAVVESHVVPNKGDRILWNPTKGSRAEMPIEMKFDGRTYILPPGKTGKFFEITARCLLSDYSHLGLVELPDDSPKTRELKRKEGLKRLYDFHLDQLQLHIEWMSDQKKRGNEVFGEDPRVTELKEIIADSEDELGLPRRLNPEIYVKVKEEKERRRLMEEKLKGSEVGSEQTDSEIESKYFAPKKQVNKREKANVNTAAA